MFSGPISSAIDVAITPYFTTESFDNKAPESKKHSTKMALISFLTMLVVFLLLLVLGKHLWNTVLVSMFTFVKPTKSMWQILGLAILLNLILPGCTCNSL